jgi:hypothetical protein
VPMEATSLHFLRKVLCVGTPKGFQVVDFESLETQYLIDPADINLRLLLQPFIAARPIAIFRVEDEFLLCYNGAPGYI